MKQLSVVLPALAGLLAGSLGAMTVQKAAIPFVWPDKAPRPDDVTMRTLWFRPVNANDTQDTFATLDAFHATRLEWVYLRAYEHEGRFEVEEGLESFVTADNLKREIDLIQRTKATGRVFGGASNASTGTDVIWHGYQDATKKHTIIDIHGEPLIGGHMKHWAAPQSPGCANNPHYLEGYIEYLMNYIRAGAETIQRDEPSGNHSYAMNGLGCYCEYCLAGFRDYLSALSPEERAKLPVDDLDSFNYREYVLAKGLASDPGADFDWSDPATMRGVISKDAVSRHFIEFQGKAQANLFRIVRMRVNEAVGYSFPFSCNNTSFQRFEPDLYQTFDFYMSELMMQSANPKHIYERSREARSLGKVQVFGAPKTMGEAYDDEFLVDLKRKVIATTYASGSLSPVPWDIFQQTRDGTGRYFGDPADYADLYALVRASSRYLIGYCDAGATGPDLDTFDPYGGTPPLRMGESGRKVYAFVRARPEDHESPVVIHLVDWRENPEPFTISLNPDKFFPDCSLKTTLRVPEEYSAGDHGKAEQAAALMRASGQLLGAGQSSAYEPLVKTVIPDAGMENNRLILHLPALEPWGILVIGKE